MSVLESNIEKIKELLTEPDYDKIQNESILLLVLMSQEYLRFY